MHILYHNASVLKIELSTENIAHRFIEIISYASTIDTVRSEKLEVRNECSGAQVKKRREDFMFLHRKHVLTNIKRA